MASACCFVMNLPERQYWDAVDPRCSHLNVGIGSDIQIRDLAKLMADVTGFRGEIVFDPDRPDGMPRKLLDVSRLESMGWRAEIGLEKGIRATYRWMVDNWGRLEAGTPNKSASREKKERLERRLARPSRVAGKCLWERPIP
jgi:nucleoside-diphosphate-sugar epimerase